MQELEFEWQTPDGIKIYAKEWKPSQQPKAAIALVHGLGEHCNRYKHVAKFFGEHGYGMVGYDRRGHGKSGGKLGHTPSYDRFLDEVDQLIKETKSRYPGLPVILYGHSMGGNIVLNELLRRKPDVKLAIVTASWIKLAFAPPAFLVALGRLTRKIIPKFTQENQLDTSHISRDAAEVKAYENDPLVHGKITSETGMAMLDAADALLKSKAEVHVPLLMMHGTGDQIISSTGSEEFANNSKGDITLKLWDGMYHEIHNEIGKEEVFNYTLDWLEAKLS